ncbi:thiosulfate sulfurtransferase [Halobellus salinus]|uniref:Thiosulfate sulfurtransferase n=1 Tax=Halobellus salinus TaxID=931585 RepID=A0A830EI69_9EURY|nr:sulfurtransferase [Halobellus salinus]GGJ07435.1 thiosulfate sulfurtransferase [Halobellus salinus]SMP25981.1 thiosulfate/3-mercaptopyruvate sulfurtransferase [Halobellus salinus]
MYDNVVVSAEWVAGRLDSARIVDVRDAWEFDGIGHVPGAVNVPFAEFRSESGDEGMLPGADTWESLLSAAGIGPDDDIVAYDDTHGVFAARFLVTAELYGHPPDRLHLLDGDFSAWNREHGSTTESSAPAAASYTVDVPDHSPLVDYDTTRAALDDPGAVIVDTREAWEFEEGHLPGAVNLDWRDLVDDDTRGLKPPEELSAVLEGVGVTPDTGVLLYCNTARRISHTYVVLRSLGYNDVGFYEGSLTEWVERGGPLDGSVPDDVLE